MIPIIYAANETVFTHNGIGLLTDAIRCEVTEERNGIYEAVIEYPITGIHYDSIAEDCIVKILPNEISNPQLFRIYKTGRPINGTITISLEHISYNLSGNPVTGYDVSGVGAAGAIQGALTAATFPHDFSAWSDITTLNSAKFDDPLSVRAILGGTAGGILDKWGGEYEFDNYVVKLHAHRGSATDVVIEYGKNLTDINQERNITNVYTSLFPYAKYVVRTPEGAETEHLVLLTENVLNAPNASSYAHKRAKIHDFSGDFDGEVTEAMLRAKANSYLAANPIDVPSVNIKVSFVQLWQTAEYANIAPLERVKLCDTVTVKFSKLGITAKAKVIKTVYDTLLERYINIELGTAKSNFAQTINNQQQQINTINQNLKIETGALKQAILDATAAITGNMSGNVIFHPSLENPQEILIMDTEDIATALKVWRWNSGGLGYSSTGYNGPYGTAITMNGEIVADFIKTGNLNAGLITTGAINADLITTGTIDADLIRAGILQSDNGTSYFDLDNNKIVSKDVDLTGKIKAVDGEIGGYIIGEKMLYSERAGYPFTRAGLQANQNAPNAPAFFAGSVTKSGTNSTATWQMASCSFDTPWSILVTLSEPHGMGTNGIIKNVYINNCSVTDYNGIHNVTLTGTNTFTFPFSSLATITQVRYYETGWLYASCDAGHGLPVGTIINNFTISNSSRPEYNGTYSVWVIDNWSFTFQFATYPGTATGKCPGFKGSATGTWAKDPLFYVNYDGRLHCENAEIGGDIIGTLSLQGNTSKMVLLNTYDTILETDFQGIFFVDIGKDVSSWGTSTSDYYDEMNAGLLCIKLDDSPYYITQLIADGTLEIITKNHYIEINSGDYIKYSATSGYHNFHINGSKVCSIRSDGIYNSDNTKVLSF